MQDPSVVRRLGLPPTPASVARARAFAASVLADWSVPHVADTVVLLVSELATNAVLHARSAYDVVLEARGDVVRVAVLDDSPVPAAARRFGLVATTGRGLGLVASLSVAWGRCEGDELGGHAKGVWCDVPVDPARLPMSEGALYGDDWLKVAEGL